MKRTASGPPPGPPMRVPPHSLDLERALLATAFVEPGTLDACDTLRSTHFYSDSYGQIWTALHGARARGLTPDHVTVRDELVRTGKLASIGGDEALFEITQRIMPTYQPEEHAREIIELAQRRDVIQVIHSLGAQGYDLAIPNADFLEQAQQRIFEATATHSKRGGLERMSALPTIQRIQDVANGLVTAMGLSTGLPALNEAINGLEPGHLYIVAGRPGMGKTSMAIGAFLEVTSSMEHCAAFFSLEMGKEKIIARAMSIRSGVPSRAMTKSHLTPDHWRLLARVSEEMSRAQDYIEDTPQMTIPAMRSSLRRMVAKSGKPIGLIVVDHIGLARSGMRTDSREQEVSEIARALKVLAKEFNCAVIGLCQLNRECEKSGDKRPQLHHLRDSGEIEQSADVVLLLYRRGYYAAEKKAGRLPEDPRVKSDIEAGDDDGKAEIIRAKARDAETGSTFVLWEGECTRFVDYGHNDYRPDARVRDDGEPWER